MAPLVPARRRRRRVLARGPGADRNGDFNTVSYDAAERILTIECSIPVTLRFDVDRLAVHVEQTEEILGRARYRTFGDAGATSYSGEVLPLDR